MRALVQRVSEARVRVDGEIIGEIEHGVLALIGVTHDDTPAQATKLAEKIAHLRIFTDDDDKMNLSVLDAGGSVLVVSQFTLYGDTRKGRRPGYVDAARPEVAEPLCDAVVDALRALDVPVQTGRFRADMKVELINNGPVTLSIEL
ncbi:MAG: D-tyrosyl-tRNA(Tyr) deacylase [Acidimicrobiaceae bacterium]|nr:D-tyrosyl-tRNA(Tyr) deacylase [Acidimicrobiaceae bacterium]